VASLVLFQSVLNILFIAFIGLLWSRLKHLTGDEGRLKQGLQILQTKIAILEDLGRKVDEQAQEMFQIMDYKKNAVEALLARADATIQNMEHKTELIATDSEVLLERENAIKFTKAAILANKGVPPKEIARKLGLGLQECELIYSLNSHQLQFKLDELPGWMLPYIPENV
jgi:uncharacterized phage infection (PIP) family protein YhgE